MKNIFLLMTLFLFCVATFAQKTVWVSNYSGATLADKLTAAQVGCTSQNPCSILIDTAFPKITGEVLPDKCANCTWIDYRPMTIPTGTVAGTLAAGDDPRFGAGGGAVSSVFGRTGAVIAAQDDYSWTLIGSKPSVFPPDTHSHAIGDTTGLQTTLDGKSATGHGHAEADVTNLVTDLAGKSATGHGHVIGDTTGLQTALDGKQATLGFTPENFANKNAASGYAGLDGSTKLTAAQLPLPGAATLGAILSSACTGNDKVTGINTSGVLTCGTDQATGSGPTFARVTADVQNTTTTFANVTGLTFGVANGTNTSFACEIYYTAAATTTALQLAINGPTSPTAMRYGVLTPTTATAKHAASQSAYDTVTNPANSLGATALPVRISGTLENGANPGTLAIRFRSEVAASAVNVLRGSYCMFVTY